MIVASYKLERIPAVKSTNIKINYQREGRSQERFGRLAGWLGPWEGIRKDTGQAKAWQKLYLKLIIILFKLNGK